MMPAGAAVNQGVFREERPLTARAEILSAAARTTNPVRGEDGPLVRLWKRGTA
jgi:uncharacterized protein YjlB